ncbi:cysteine desulfurase, mitochondrial [Trichuris trichiura]|uniref:cysteine desulfurase n=1 Tax=Trichuris trichiura TaxID=36087 RepID=A0A077Z8J2_TRITR|nr:cysteine desulfurase, mitochondrial [Trichuris trichiura]
MISVSKGKLPVSSFRKRVQHAFATSASRADTDSLSAIKQRTVEDYERAGVRPLYMDVQSTTPMDPRVLDAMLPYFTYQFGNPHSRTHTYGWESEAAVEAARKDLADLVGADPREIVFTSGATEANNLAIKGVTHFYKDKKNHVITTQTEHKCVLDSCRYLENEGFKVTYLPVESNGLLDLHRLEEAITDKTSLVSVMTVNNEIGVIQPIEKIGELCRRRKVFFHTDGAQAVGKIPMNVNKLTVDLMSISGHKIYGPKGVGALYVRRRPRVRLEAQMSGGGQERGLRSGTVPTPLVVGFGAACRICRDEMEFDYAHVKSLSDRLINGIQSSVEHAILNGDPVSRYPGESLLMALKEVALSSGSACTSASLEPSYVLRAIGADEDLAHSSIRFGIGRFTTAEEVDYTVSKCAKEVARLREMSPLWEMFQEGVDIKSVKWVQH